MALARTTPRASNPINQTAHGAVTALVTAAALVSTAAAQQTTPAAPQQAPAASSPPAAAAAKMQIPIVLARQIRDEPPPLSLLDQPPEDHGIAGAKLAIADNNTTGRFLNQDFTLEVVQSDKPEELVAEVKKRVEAGAGFVVADVEPETLLAMADAIKGTNALILNAGSVDDGLREEQCRANVKHTAPTRTMLADALAQYMAWKRWNRWFVVMGPNEEDKALAEAYRRAAKRFGIKIIEERVYHYDPGSRRSDGGFEQIQQQMPSFTQNAKEHDVVLVVDEGNLFADYLPYRTWEAKPVVGSAGLVPTTWHPAVELWGGTQFQNRFKRMSGRTMRPLDYNVWIAVRSVGEAATRTKSNAPADLIKYIGSKEFELAAFKGQKLTYRDWNGQLRQPLLLVTGKLHVTVSPQPGFLHQFSELDTLGIDRPETKCRAYTQ